MANGLETTLPSSWYTQQAVFDIEREHIFMREWLCMGRAEDLAGPGDHRILDVFGESVILLRNHDSELRAFYNVCRHRGARLCTHPGDGESILRGGIGRKSITCPYHAWTYDFDGRLVRAPHMAEGNGFDPSAIRLHPVGVETWGGFVFINMTPDDAPEFKAQMAPMTEKWHRYALQDLRVARTITYEAHANWKILCENYNECYHCGPVHPELCRIVPAFREGGGSDLDWAGGIPHREGAVTFTGDGTTNRRPIPTLNEAERTKHFGELIFPNLFISLSCDHVAAFILTPQGPGRCEVQCLFLFEPFEMEKADFDPSDAVDFWDLVNRQDWAICARVQQGISSRVHHHGLCSPMEDWTLDVRKYVTDRIGDHIPGEAES
ncbi:MAG: aromatic ring-hydroxylating dioxygenase subunit alpha [Xanthomonadales bacterium]|nr:aromatic ring-hydroxylating dioxygenase subunit alpha [Xanthomonadales bacterium]